MKKRQDIEPLEQYAYHARGHGRPGTRGTRYNVFESPMESGRHTTFMIETTRGQHERGAVIVEGTGPIARVNFLSTRVADKLRWMAHGPFSSQRGRKLEMPLAEQVK